MCRNPYWHTSSTHSLSNLFVHSQLKQKQRTRAVALPAGILQLLNWRILTNSEKQPHNWDMFQGRVGERVITMSNESSWLGKMTVVMNDSFMTHHCRVYYPYHHYNHASTRDRGHSPRFTLSCSFQRLNALTFTTDKNKKKINKKVRKHIGIAMLCISWSRPLVKWLWITTQSSAAVVS